MRRWLSRPIRARQSFPQVGQVCSEPMVDVLSARTLRAVRFISASFSLLYSALRAPFVIPARHAERFLQDFPTCCHRCQSFSQKPSSCLCIAFSVLQLSVSPWIVRHRRAVLGFGSRLSYIRITCPAHLSWAFKFLQKRVNVWDGCSSQDF